MLKKRKESKKNRIPFYVFDKQIVCFYNKKVIGCNFKNEIGASVI